MLVPRLKPWVDVAACADILADTRAVPARRREEYEEALRSRLGAARVYALNSARAALTVGLAIMGVGRRDEVVIPALTCPAVADAVLWLSGIPHLVDISARHFGMESRSLARVLAKGRTRAAVTAPLFGGCPPCTEVEEMLAARGVPQLEDAAQSFGSRRAGRPAGSRAPVAVFSTNFDKPYTTGRGGALVVNDPSLVGAAEGVVSKLDEQTAAEAAAVIAGLLIGEATFSRRRYETFVSVDAPFDFAGAPEGRAYAANLMSREGREAAAAACIEAVRSAAPPRRPFLLARGWRWLYPRSAVPAAAAPRRLAPALAAVGLTHLAAVDREGERRRGLAARLDAAFAGCDVARGPTWGGAGDEPWPIRYPLFVTGGGGRDEVVRRLKEAGYEGGPFVYPRPLSGTFPYYKLARRTGRSLRGAWRAAAALVNLPLHVEVTAEDCDRMAAAVKG